MSSSAKGDDTSSRLVESSSAPPSDFSFIVEDLLAQMVCTFTPKPIAREAYRYNDNPCDTDELLRLSFLLLKANKIQQCGEQYYGTYG
jgi:hypothetical protein